MKGLGLTVFLAVILIGAIGSLLLEDVLVRTPDVRAPVSDAPLYFFEDFTMRVMSKEGHPDYVLVGRTLSGYRDDEVDARIAAPAIAIDVPPQPGWNVTADQGSVLQGGDLLRLRGGVVLRQSGARATTPLRIETEALDVYASERVAETEAAVDITAPQWRVRSNGMHARFREGLVDLLANVHARYTPAETTP